MKLDQVEIDERLQALDGWSRKEDSITRELKFKDFMAAFGFMTRVAAEAERLRHHPDWCNVYNKVTVTLSTHEAGGVTELDFELARAIDRLAKGVQTSSI